MTWAQSQEHMWSHREPMLQERALSWMHHPRVCVLMAASWQPPTYSNPPVCFSCKAMSRGCALLGECFHEIIWLKDTGKSPTPPPQLGLQHHTSKLPAGSSCPIPWRNIPRVCRQLSPAAHIEPQSSQHYLSSSAGVGTPLSPCKWPFLALT